MKFTITFLAITTSLIAMIYSEYHTAYKFFVCGLLVVSLVIALDDDINKLEEEDDDEEIN